VTAEGVQQTAARLWRNVRAPGSPPPAVLPVAIVLAVGTLVLIALLLWLGVRHHDKAAWHFFEHRAGTFYSGALLLVSAALALAITRRLTGRRFGRFWLVATVGFVYLAADELTSIHEDIDWWVNKRLGRRADDRWTDHIDDSLVLLYGVVAVAWAFRHRDALLRLRWATCLLSFAFLGFIVTSVLDVLSLNAAVEESAKLFAEALIVSGLFAALRDPVLADVP